MTKRKARSMKEFVYLLPFIIIVAIFSYYPLYGWAYSFFDYRPSLLLSLDFFVGLKWFKSLVENEIYRIQRRVCGLLIAH
jgi:putative aldouronate transport system permease protein